MKIKMPRCTCNILNVFKSGWLWKLPPQDKIKKGYTAKERWCTLGKIEVCNECSGGNKLFEERRPFLMFSYYKDGEERDLKGRLNVEQCVVEQVSTVEENPRKFQQEKYILKLHLQSSRILYLLMRKEQDLNGWLNALKLHIKNAEEIDEEESSSEEEEDNIEEMLCNSPVRRFTESDKLEMRLTLLRDLRHQHPEVDISPLSEESKVTQLLEPDGMSSGDSNTLTDRLSRISEASNRTSGFCSLRSESDASAFDNKRISNISAASSTSYSSRDSALSFSDPNCD